MDEINGWEGFYPFLSKQNISNGLWHLKMNLNKWSSIRSDRDKGLFSGNLKNCTWQFHALEQATAHPTHFHPSFLFEREFLKFGNFFFNVFWAFCSIEMRKIAFLFSNFQSSPPYAIQNSNSNFCIFVSLSMEGKSILLQFEWANEVPDCSLHGKLHKKHAESDFDPQHARHISANLPLKRTKSG